VLYLAIERPFMNLRDLRVFGGRDARQATAASSPATSTSISSSLVR